MSRRRLQQQGDLYKQGGWWKLRWRVDVITEAGAKRAWSKPVIVGPCAGNVVMNSITEKEARRLAWENFLSRLDQNNRTPQSITTVGQFWTRKFFPEHVAMLKPSGREHYERCWKHIEPVLGGLQLREVTGDHVQYLVSSLLTKTWTPTAPKDGAQAKPRSYSVQTALHVRNCVSGIFTHAIEKGWYAGQNPAAHVRLPEMQRREAHSLVFDQARALLGVCDTPLREMVYSLIILSCNVAELLGLQWRHVNLSGEWASVDGEALPPWSLAIRQQWRLGQYGSVKAAGRRRDIQIPLALRSTFAGLKARQHRTGPEDPVFISRTGRPLDQHGYLRTLKRKGALVGMPWISWHVFRRTHATLTKIVGREIGLSDHDRMRLMGHSSLSLTDRYTAAEVDRQQAALQVIAERLMGDVKGGVQ